MTAGLYLVVPIKPLHSAKSRLFGAADRGRGQHAAHASLVTAVALDTVRAARAASGVTGVVVVTSDPELTRAFTADGVEVLPDSPGAGLNAALCHGDDVLRRRGSASRTGALQADLPALRPADLSAAEGASAGGRAFCADRQGTGTTLLLAEPGHPLQPAFGPNSASEHERSGATELHGPWDSLRCDVDTAEDLRLAAELGVGPRTSANLAGIGPPAVATEGAAACATLPRRPDHRP